MFRGIIGLFLLVCAPSWTWSHEVEVDSVIEQLDSVAEPERALTQERAEELVKAFENAFAAMEALVRAGLVENAVQSSEARHDLERLARAVGGSFLQYANGSYRDLPNTRKQIDQLKDLLNKVTVDRFHNPKFNYVVDRMAESPVSKFFGRLFEYTGNVVVTVWRDAWSLVGFETPGGWDPLGLRQRRRSQSLSKIVQSLRLRMETYNSQFRISPNSESQIGIRSFTQTFDQFVRAFPIEDGLIHRRITYAYIGMTLFFFLQPIDFFPVRTRFSTEVAGDLEMLTMLTLMWSHYHNQGVEIFRTATNPIEWVKKSGSPGAVSRLCSHILNSVKRGGSKIFR